MTAISLPIPTRKKYKQICGDNPKMVKTNKIKGVVSTIWHGAPAKMSGYQMCPFADLCLNAIRIDPAGAAPSGYEYLELIHPELSDTGDKP